MGKCCQNALKVINGIVILAVRQPSDETIAERHAWALLSAARRFTDEKMTIEESYTADRESVCALRWQAAQEEIETLAGNDHRADISLSLVHGWQIRHGLPKATQHLLELYLPVLGSPLVPQVVVAHLGQSIDSRIATSVGDAFFVTGEENRKHLHRMRSMCQAVLVGAGTVLADNPQLTTRAVSGRNPVRVIIDPKARLPRGMKVLEDGEAPTWLLHDERHLAATESLPSGCRRLGVAMVDGEMQPRSILETLSREGIHRVFVEGGGVTVSRFLRAACLNRLQIAIAPLLVGDGIPALQIPGAARMLDALRPDHRVYRMGEDILWDFIFSTNSERGLPESKGAVQSGKLRRENTGRVPEAGKTGAESLIEHPMEKSNKKTIHGPTENTISSAKENISATQLPETQLLWSKLRRRS